MDDEEYDNDISNEPEYSEDEDLTELNVEDEENKTDEHGFKLVTYKNVLENMSKILVFQKKQNYKVFLINCN